MIKVFKNTGDIAEALAGLLFEMKKRPGNTHMHIALSGGNTPKAIFRYLTEHYGDKLADRRFHFWWGDDRCVPPSDDESNYKWAYELWLKPMGIKDENIHRVMGENEAENEAIRYTDTLKKHVKTKNGWPVIDLNILGLGDDGHTASIFPHCMELLNDEHWCAVAIHPVSGQKRITFTGEVLNHVQKTVFIVTGAGKAKMVKSVALDGLLQYPASHIRPLSGDLSWFIDEAAAQLLYIPF
ncbi:MAG: 6-phosphogluconolactonase [Prolixibacteraceae bacterium]|nr:6-phosphogluconolactonase [Prolixibacteraceae bacterium]